MEGEYTGFQTVSLRDDEVAEFYERLQENRYGCLTNEYLSAETTDGSPIDLYRWNGSQMVKVPFKTISTRYSGKIKPRNIQQQMTVDLLYNDSVTIKMLTGKFGTGKDLMMSSVAIDLLERGKVEKIVYVRNNIEVKDSKPIGFLPGSNNDKLMPYAMVLADKLGSVDALELMINQGKIEIQHLGFLRGRDIKNSIIYCSECENMTKEHVQLLIGRVGEGSSLWLNGDIRQTDMEVFRHNSGMQRAIDRLKGHPRFGYVKLLKTERSETAAMADLLD